MSNTENEGDDFHREVPSFEVTLKLKSNLVSGPVNKIMAGARAEDSHRMNHRMV